MAEVDIGRLTRTIADIGGVSKDVVASTQNLKDVINTFDKTYTKEGRKSLRTIKDLSRIFERSLKSVSEKMDKSEQITSEQYKLLNQKYTNLNNALEELLKQISVKNTGGVNDKQIQSINSLTKTISVSFSELSKKINEQNKVKSLQPKAKSTPNTPQQKPANVPTVKPMVGKKEEKQVVVENSEKEKSWLTKMYEKFWGDDSINNKSKEELLDGIKDTIQFQQRELIKGAEGILYGSLTHTKYGGVGKQEEAKRFIQSVLDAIEEHKKNTGSKFDELPKEKLLQLIESNLELNDHQKKYLKNHFFEAKKQKSKEPKEDIGIIRKLLMLTPFLLSVFSGMSLPSMIATIVAGTFATIIAGPYLMKVVSAYLRSGLTAKILGAFVESKSFDKIKNLLGSSSDDILENVGKKGKWAKKARAIKMSRYAQKAKNFLGGGKELLTSVARKVGPTLARSALTTAGAGMELGSMIAPALTAAAVPVAVATAAAIGGTYMATKVAEDKSNREAQNQTVLSGVMSQANLMAKKAKTPEDFKKIDKLLKEEAQRQKQLDKGAGFFGGDTDIGEKASEELLKYNKQLQEKSLQILENNAKKLEAPKSDVKASTEKMVVATEKTTKVFENGINKLDETMTRVGDLVEQLKVNNTVINNTQNNNRVDLGINFNRPSMMVPQA